MHCKLDMFFARSSSSKARWCPHIEYRRHDLTSQHLQHLRSGKSRKQDRPASSDDRAVMELRATLEVVATQDKLHAVATEVR